MDSQPISCHYCREKTHTSQYCDKQAKDNGVQIPATVRIRLPHRSMWSFNDSRYTHIREGDTYSTRNFQFTINRGSLRIHGFPPVYVRLRDTDGHMMETVWVAGVFPNSERYAVIQGCLFTRTKQSEFERVMIRTRPYITVDVRAKDLLSEPIDVWYLGYYYKLLWLGPNKVMSIPRDEANFLVNYFKNRPDRRNFVNNLAIMPYNPDNPAEQDAQFQLVPFEEVD